jgi:hypothetical protein
MGRNVKIVTDTEGHRIAVINGIIFKGKRSVNWDDVEHYLRQYVGKSYEIFGTKDIIHIGSDMPDEYAHSNYTVSLWGTGAKAKANAAQGIPEMIEIATGKVFKENRKEKHDKNAKYGWYQYESYFAVPVFRENGEVERYNVFSALMLVRHDKNDRFYLYDIINIKKETNNLFVSEDLTQ